MTPAWVSCLYLSVAVLLGSFADESTLQENVSERRHECDRPCLDGEVARVCYFHFTLEWYHTLGRACFNCPLNTTDCSRPECIAAEGTSRAIVTVNRMLPGPIIQVCKGDTIIVDVKNNLEAETTAIHWHGMHQLGTPYMDGVPMVTQCPIMPLSTFRYEFEARNAGTHFWHSHAGLQRTDGAYGAIIVRQTVNTDPHSSLYDFDLAEHVILLTDWNKVVGIEKLTSHFYNGGNNKPDSLLVNGKGRFLRYQNNVTHQEVYTPSEVFMVEQGKRYRFRVISNGVLNCPIVLSVDNHTLTIITSDGSPVSPFKTDALVLYAGERFDFILNANLPIGNYWMRLQGIMDCDERFTKAKQVAILRYKGAASEDPLGSIGYTEMGREGLQLNPLNSGSKGLLKTMVDLESLLPDDETSKEEPDFKYYLTFDVNFLNTKLYHHPKYYPINEFHHSQRIYVPQVNNISLILPSSPLLSQYKSIDSNLFCNETTVKENCSVKHCECIHVISVPLGAVVELVMIDTGFYYDANHPIHIHGHAFRVLAMDRIGNQVTLDEIKRRDEAGEIPRKLSKAVLKDTVTIPDGGYTIIRLIANNPGFWLVHCHISFHLEMGMAFILKVGEHSQIPQKPLNFPTCGDWVPQMEPLTDSSANNKSDQLQLLLVLLLCITFSVFITYTL